MSIEIKDTKLKKVIAKFQNLLYNDIFDYLSRVKELYKKEISTKVIDEHIRIAKEFINQLDQLLSEV